MSIVGPALLFAAVGCDSDSGGGEGGGGLGGSSADAALPGGSGGSGGGGGQPHGGTGGAPPGGTSADAAPPIDASAPEDTGIAVDQAVTPDAAAHDAGVIDGGSIDGGAIDGSHPIDGGATDGPRPHDAAPHDAAPHDAAPHDAAPHDAAHPEDVPLPPDMGPPPPPSCFDLLGQPCEVATEGCCDSEGNGQTWCMPDANGAMTWQSIPQDASCFCFEDPATSKTMMACAVPGFVGIDRPNRPRRYGRRLRGLAAAA